MRGMSQMTEDGRQMTDIGIDFRLLDRPSSVVRLPSSVLRCTPR